MPHRTLTNILQGQASVCGYVDEEHCLPLVPLKGDVLVPVNGQGPVVVDGVIHRGVAVHLWGEEHPVAAGWGLSAPCSPPHGQQGKGASPAVGTAASVVSPALNAAGSGRAPACQGRGGGTGWLGRADVPGAGCSRGNVHRTRRVAAKHRGTGKASTRIPRLWASEQDPPPLEALGDGAGQRAPGGMGNGPGRVELEQPLHPGPQGLTQRSPPPVPTRVPRLSPVPPRGYFGSWQEVKSQGLYSRNEGSVGLWGPGGKVGTMAGG